MKKYSVKEVSKLSGVTIRTLHYYDKIGLLKPKERTEVGYRYYGETELLRLQQILFYKELDFSLENISQLLDDPEYDLIEGLMSHKKALKKRGEQIRTLLKTIDKTIDYLTKEKKMMKPEMLYKGLPKEMGTVYREQAIEEYGRDLVENAETELLKLGEANFESLKKNFEKVNKELFELRRTSPEDDKVQRLISQHYQIIRTFWGTAGSKDSQGKAYAGLGELYVADERYTMVDGQPQPQYAQFLKEAMRYYAETQLL
ncbi:MerR family transcriptional regulator [Flagellimonas sp.]|uniref:MerR family transcriptional regulator n=1 Tax=Flagellimonas sp. TaxID=2058762 RepID=UPI003B5C2B70